MAAYILALLTNRILLVDLGNQILMRDLFQEPFEGSSWEIPKVLVNKLYAANKVPPAWEVVSRERRVIKIARLHSS